MQRNLNIGLSALVELLQTHQLLQTHRNTDHMSEYKISSWGKQAFKQVICFSWKRDKLEHVRKQLQHKKKQLDYLEQENDYSLDCKSGYY